MCLDFALETNSRLSSCLLIRIEAGLWEDGGESQGQLCLVLVLFFFICLRSPCLGRMAAEMIAAGLGCVLFPLFAGFLYFGASFTCICLPHFYACSRVSSCLQSVCCLPAVQSHVTKM